MHLVQSLFLLFTFFITHHVEKTEYFSCGCRRIYQNIMGKQPGKKLQPIFIHSVILQNFIFGGNKMMRNMILKPPKIKFAV